MNVSIGDRWEGLRLVEEREVKLRALRATLDASIAEGGSRSDEDPQAELDAVTNTLKREGD